MSGGSLGNGFYIDLDPRFVTHVKAGEERKNLALDNRTGQELFLGNRNYLGISIRAGTRRDVSIPRRLTNVMVFDADSTFFREVVLDTDTIKIVE